MNTTPIELSKAGAQHTDALMTLVRSCYGQSCSEPRFYSRYALSTAILRQELEIYIAQAPDGQIVAMEVCEQQSHFPGTIYLKNKMTLPSYQGQGIGKQLTAHLLAQLDYSSLLSLFAYSLTYTTITQGSLYRLGAVMTGLLYNSYLRADTIATNKSDSPKRSHVIMVKRLDKEPPPTLSVPAVLATMAQKVYYALGVQTIELSHRLTPPLGLSTVTLLRHDDHHHTELVVNRCGSDLLQLVATATEHGNGDELATCNLFLNMIDPATAYIYDELCRMGFVFSGFMPLSHNNEYLVMYYSQQVAVPTDKLTILPVFVPLSQSILDFSNRRTRGSEEDTEQNEEIK